MDNDGTQMGGSVHMCKTASNRNCQLFSIELNTGVKWFGSTVASSSGIPLVCAQKSVVYNSAGNPSLGQCFIGTKGSNLVKDIFYRPNGYWTVTSLYSDITPEGDKVLIPTCKLGATLFNYQATTGLQINSLFQENVTRSSWPDFYLGYSTSFIKLDDSGYHVAISSPHTDRIRTPSPPSGLVYILNPRMDFASAISGFQVGEYFGYCLAAADVNKDRKEELFIGAPLYTNYDSQSQFEVGRVYVYQMESLIPRITFKEPKILEIQNSRARFGSAITALGDINGDGFQDVAIGAPYYRDNSVNEVQYGAVFIFLGSQSGISDKASQIIRPSDMGQSWKSFGFSLAAGADVDSNGYNDLVIGAYESDRVVLLQSRPVAYLKSESTLLSFSSSQIDLDVKNCQLKDRNPVACAILNFCLEYTGLGQVSNRLSFKMDIGLDTKSFRFPRLGFTQAEGNATLTGVLSLNKNNRQCQSFEVYVRSGIRDKLTSFEATLNLTLVEENKPLATILDARAKVQYITSIAIQKDCGPDNVCIPDLQLSMDMFPNKYVQGNRTKFQVTLTVNNKAEDAYETQLFFYFPEELEYISAIAVNTDDVLCSPPTEATGRYLICDIGNPLRSRTPARILVSLQPSAAVFTKNMTIFTIETNSTNREDNRTYADNKLTGRIPIIVETGGLHIINVSNPLNIQVNLTEQAGSLEEIMSKTQNRRVLHIFDISNKGPSLILEANVEICWPTYTAQGDELMNITAQPGIRGPATCDAIPGISLDVQEDKGNEQGDPALISNRTTARTRFARSVPKEDAGIRNTCDPGKQTLIRCRIGQLSNTDNVLITIVASLNISTVIKLASTEYENFIISSSISANVTSLPLNADHTKLDPVNLKASTNIAIIRHLKITVAAPSWVLAASIGGGIALLGLLALLLHQLGFFKRNRPQDFQDDQPLADNQENAQTTENSSLKE